MFATSNALQQEQRKNSSSTIKNHSNTVSEKENGNFPETKLKVTEYCDLTDRKLKIAVLKKVKKLQENSRRQFSELRNKIHKQKVHFTKAI